jgi:hypothetical protein
MPKHVVRAAVVMALFVTTSIPGAAQPGATVTVADYERAERFMSWNANRLVSNGPVSPNWLAGDRFWYRTQTARGFEFVLVDPVKATKAPAFDHAAVAIALSTAMKRAIAADQLPFQQITFADDAQSFSFNTDLLRWTCDVAGKQCTSTDRPASTRNAMVSPDGKLAAFIRNHNLWVRDLATGTEKQLTTDGVKDYGYATDNAGWRFSDAPVLKWSPDSKKIATFRQDQRKTGEMYLVNTVVGHPTLLAWKYPLPGDPDITMIERVVIEVDGPRVIPLQMGADQHRSTICDDVICDGEWVDVQWHPDGSHVSFVSTSRNHQQANLRVADATTGAIREVLEEKGETFLESGNDHVNWRYLPKSNEAIWFSQKDNWGHLYLHDLESGKLKRQITSPGCCASTKGRAPCISKALGARTDATPTSATSTASAWTARHRSC